MKKKFSLVLSIAFLTFLFVQCDLNDDDDIIVLPVGSFTVTIENVSEVFDYFQSGVFNTPVGASDPGPLMPGNSYSFSFYASKGHKLSFATMYVQSNDLFFAPGSDGFDLFDGDTPKTGDITSMVKLWDAGTEVNEEPGTGANQAPRQSGANTGSAENGTVRDIMNVNDGFTYPAVDQTIQVMLDYDGTSMFTVTIENLAGSSSPLAPGVYLVHDAPNALFEEGQNNYGNGLEGVAEDGAADPLGDYFMIKSGYSSPFAPGVFILHAGNSNPLFADGQTDYRNGLEALAEDGNPADLGASLGAYGAVFNTPDGAAGPGPLLPGESYSFSFQAQAGDYLSFATMLVHTNDLFFALDDSGIQLFNGEMPISGDLTSQVYLWDAGTEVNQFPGAGINQPARLNGGDVENGNVMQVNDGFTYPAVSAMIKVTISGS